MITVEQIVNSHESNLETSFGLAGTVFEGVQQLVGFNIQAAKSALSEAAQTSQAALSIKDPQELVAFQAALLQPAGERAAAYSRGVYEIAASTGAEVTRVMEATTAEARVRFLALVDTAVKNAPAGSEHGVAFVNVKCSKDVTLRQGTQALAGRGRNWSLCHLTASRLLPTF